MNNEVVRNEQTARISAGRRLLALATTSIALLLSATLALTGLPMQALADEGAGETSSATTQLQFAGVDFLQPQAEVWEILRVDGLLNQKLYLDVERCEEGKVTASLLGRAEYDPATHGSTTEGVGEDIAHIVAVDLQGETPAQALSDSDKHITYQVRVYGERRGGDPLFEATVYPVYAQLKAEGATVSYELLGVRTVETGTAATTTSRNVGAGLTFYKEVATGAGNTVTETYGLQAPDVARDNGFDPSMDAFVVPYERQASDAVKGSIRYVDLNGTLIKEVPVTDFDESGKATVRIETSFLKASDDDPEHMRYYRVISNLAGSTMTLTAANAHGIVRVVEVAEMAQSDYSVTIRYQDEEGDLLWSDTVDVKGYGYQYTLPTTFSMVETDGVEMYSLETVEGNVTETAGDGRSALRDWGAPTIAFDNSIDPSRDFLTDEAGNYYLNANYISSRSTRLATLTLVAVDGSTGQRLPDAAQPGVLEVTPEKTASYLPQTQVIDGVTYVPWSGNAEAITYSWDDLAQGIDLLQYVYYVPEGYDPDEAYEVTVQYLNVADSAVLRSETVTIEPGMTNYLTIVGEESFTEAGNDYVRLAGQENGIRHGYYTPARTYTVYYRDVNDELNASTVIRRTQIINTERVVEVPGTVTTAFTAAPVTVAAATADGATAGAAAADTVDAGVSAGDGTVVINDDANPLANQAGQDTATERTIAENDTPLSAGLESEAEGSSALPSAAVVVSVLGAAVIAGCVIAYLMVRRMSSSKKNPTSESPLINR